MTDTLAIGRLQTRFRTPTARARDRLLRLPDQLVDRALTDAITAAGIFANEHLCVRRLHVQLGMDLREPDAALLDRWAARLTTQLAEQLRSGQDQGVLRYRSKRAALVDLVFSVLAGDRRRAWAWRQLDFVIDGTDSAVIVSALRGTPEATFAVVEEARRRDLLAKLISTLPAAEWIDLAAEVLAIHRLPTAWSAPALLTVSATVAAAIEPDLPTAGPTTATPLAARAPQKVRSVAEHLLASPVGVALQRLFEHLDPERRTALTVLLALGVAPARIAALGAEGRDVLSLVRQRLAPTADEVARTTALHETDPDPLTVAAATHDALPAEAHAPIDRAERPQGWSDHGGLLFVIHLLEDHIEALLAAAPERPLPWILHRLALTLLELADDDPAALAFAGLPPDAPPPNAGRAGRTPRPVEPAEQTAVDVVAKALRASLDALLEDHDFEAICARRALIVADPGWFSVHLALDDVDVDVRRAGLDLDPGHVPWLGVVLEFVYG